MNDEKLNIRLQRLREAQKLSVKEVAALIDVPESTYREWEYGRAITGEPYVKMAQVLKVNVYELLTGQKNRKQEELILILDEVKNLHEKLEYKLISFF